MLKKYILPLFSLLIILCVVYYFLGGFNTIKIQIVNTENYVIAGKTYQGSFKEDSLKAHFFQMKAYVDRGQLEGTVSVVNYDLEYTSADSIHQLMGVLLDAPPFKPVDIQDIQIDTLVAQKALRVIVKAHPAVMPRPDQVVKKIQAYARENSLLLKEYSIEQYVADNEIWVDVPLAQDIQ